ncbi:MAG: hypothetical protein AAF556_09700 [Pseudomonadota bacterium]
MKGLLVLLTMLAVLAAAGGAIGYAVFGDDFYDIITVAEARLKAAQREAQELAGSADTDATERGDVAEADDRDGTDQGGETASGQASLPGAENGGDDVSDQPSAVAAPKEQQVAARPAPGQALTAQAVIFTDDDGLFSSVFPAPVSRFDNFVQGIDPEMVSKSVTYASAGREIIAQVSHLSWQQQFAPVIRPMLDAIRLDPKPALASELGQRLVSVLLGEGTRIDQVRRFDAFDRDAVELTGAIPDGDQGGHYAVIWLIPDAEKLFVVVVRAYDNNRLLGAEAAQFNQNFQLLPQEVGLNSEPISDAPIPVEPNQEPVSVE